MKKKITRERDGSEVRKAIDLWAKIQREEKEWVSLIRAMTDTKEEMAESNRRYRKAKHDFKTNVKVEEVIHDIEGIMFSIYGYTLEQIRMRNRERDLVDCRRSLSIVLVKVFRFTLEAVGAAVNRDHSSIIHHMETHDGIMESDEVYRTNFNRFLECIAEISVPPEPAQTA